MARKRPTQSNIVFVRYFQNDFFFLLFFFSILQQWHLQCIYFYFIYLFYILMNKCIANKSLFCARLHLLDAQDGSSSLFFLNNSLNSRCLSHVVRTCSPQRMQMWAPLVGNFIDPLLLGSGPLHTRYRSEDWGPLWVHKHELERSGVMRPLL